MSNVSLVIQRYFSEAVRSTAGFFQNGWAGGCAQKMCLDEHIQNYPESYERLGPL